MSKIIELDSDTPETTLSYGRAVGEALRPGDFVAISGPLGAGKTVLVKGIALGLGVPAAEPVVSPTFVLVREYRGRLRLYHLDAYRLGKAAELLDLGLEEMYERPDSVVALEWADRVPEAVPQRAWRVELEHVSPTGRRVLIGLPDECRRAELAARLPDGLGDPRSVS